MLSRANEHSVPHDHGRYNELLDFCVGIILGKTDPLFAVGVGKDNFVFAGGEEVADDEVVVVAVEGCACFGKEEGGVGFELTFISLES